MTIISHFPSPESIGTWPRERRPVLDWLMNETSSQRFLDNLLVEMCERLVAAGIPVARSSLHLRIQHPQWQGARILWLPGIGEANIDTFDYDVDTTELFLRRPATEIYDGASVIRQHLHAGDNDLVRYPLFEELQRDGFTDYVAWPIEHTLGRRHVVTFATKQQGGFSEYEIAYLMDLLPALALASEIRMKNAMARTLLETYVGPHASAEILAGATTRGSGKTVNAAIMICDLRDFTALSDLWPRDDVIDILNGYFDALCEPVEVRGGEILKFMGDGLLAIFPLSNPNACADLLQAICDGRERMGALNAKLAESGKPELRYGIGVHVGDVMYGNIGSRKRLDFTAIGPAVNVASRLEELTKVIKRPVLLSSEFVKIACASKQFVDLGSHSLRGLEAPVSVFGMQE
ncbi:adenylate/guanylate cyclase domain-containing protein [Rhizobium sp. P32RR-XVIII]|uniref:adenylate/guanylate cyclase domain-containing protein n=1 Tax=Rhizobium sp. P32RR-XVIII TaxID=2726738 RepID=UPI0014576E97|nr:adenylate/guanylate cyclase domain-containing protein [Rhizobium sp. P32RR-XVIII]NLS07767.1 adenylate/guanylate cyclase domain-containing protein [Rhizobium sp. P32RR-XVIII]